MAKDIRICFVGDSLVNGTGDQDALGWAGRLCALSRSDDIEITYYNLGIRGHTSGDILLRLDNEVTPRLGRADDGRVVLSFGVNDAILEKSTTRVAEEESVKNFIQILEKLQLKYRVLVVGPPPTVDEEQNKRIQVLNAFFCTQAKNQNIPFVDIFSELKNDEEYKNEIRNNDGAHPRSAGYEKISNIIESSGLWWFSKVNI